MKETTSMKLFRHPFLQSSAFLAILGVACFIGSTITAFAQSGMDRAVSLHLGETTLERFVNALSEKTGQKIIAESYLKEHLLTVEVSSTPAKDLIAALLEINGWRTVKKENGDLVITHKLLPHSNSLTELPNGLRQIIPSSWFVFMGDEFDPEEGYSELELAKLRGYQEQLSEAENEDEKQQHLNAIKSEKANLKRIRSFNKQLINAGFTPVSRMLFPKVPQPLIKNQPYPYSKWTPEDKKGAMTILFIQMIQALNSGLTARTLLAGKIPDYLLHPENTSLAIKNGFFYVEERSFDGSQTRKSFGMQILPSPEKK